MTVVHTTSTAVFACHSAACAPPPAGRGGSLSSSQVYSRYRPTPAGSLKPGQGVAYPRPTHKGETGPDGVFRAVNTGMGGNARYHAEVTTVKPLGKIGGKDEVGVHIKFADGREDVIRVMSTDMLRASRGRRRT